VCQVDIYSLFNLICNIVLIVRHILVSVVNMLHVFLRSWFCV